MSGELNYLEMPDEDVMKLAGPPAPVAAVTDAAAGAETNTEEKLAEGSAATGSDEGDEGEEEAGKGGEVKGTEAPKVDGEGNDDGDGGTPAKEAAAKPGDDTTDPKTAAKEGQVEAEKGVKDAAKGAGEGEAKPIDYEAEYKRVLAPFKANGRDVQVNSIEDAISLMQMGANYNKKMAGLKPTLKIVKLLENNGLMSEEKIGFLIDLDKKNPGAIQKLIKESGIDPLEIDADKASAYKQTAYAVDDREIELDTVLDEIQGSQSYARTLDVVSNKWDVASKQVVSQAPQLLKVINDHMASGVYDLISAEIERDRMFGRLKGVSDIDAYRQVGDAIQARGGFNHLFQKDQVKTPDKPVIVQPKPKVDNSTLNDKRRAASSPKPAAPSTTPADFNPLGMSDEEFSKLAVPKFR